MSNKKDLSSVYRTTSIHIIKAPVPNPDKHSGSVIKFSGDGRGGKK